MINPDYPLFVGFAGNAGSGKTETARAIVPASSFASYGDVDRNNQLGDAFPHTVWDHYWLSLPLYEMYEIRTKTIGVDQKDRILYALSDVVNEIMKKNIPFDDMIELVYSIYSFPIDSNEEKPRNFLTGVGDLCRNLHNECFIDYIKYKLLDLWRGHQVEYGRLNQDPPLYIPIVSDVRMLHEAQMILDQPNHLLLKFNVSEKVQAQRLTERDGQTISPEQLSHDTETSLNDIPEDWFDFIIDTDELTLEDQAKMVYTLIANTVNPKEEALNG